MAVPRKPDYSDAATIFFHDGYRLARQFLEKGLSGSTIAGLMWAVYEALDGLIESFRNRCVREGLTVDCRKACDLCCSQAVLVSAHEILLIRRYLDGRHDAAALEGIRRRSMEKNEKTRVMTAMEFLRYIHPCPFLEDGCCLVYPVRPVACRCYLSSSFESCREQYNHPRDHTRIAALYEFPLRAGRGMNEGLRSALMEAGLIPGEWLLESYMAQVLENEQVLDDWLAGRNSFRLRSLTPDENSYLRHYYDQAP